MGGRQVGSPRLSRCTHLTGSWDTVGAGGHQGSCQESHRENHRQDSPHPVKQVAAEGPFWEQKASLLSYPRFGQ